ncbi:uncharacterized protein LOC134287558 isoform X2 [Aedes albopictus]|uniref:CCHC-type domain-containing protein n=1 Tax=Aedes albopictus TaxID=7160 RepID=A0ABM1ZGJ4_AEDAL
MADQPNDEIYHNGAAEAPGRYVKLRRKKKKATKKANELDNMAKELEKEKHEKAEMAEQLKNLQAEVEAMKAARAEHPRHEKEVDDGSVDFEIVPASSTHRPNKSMASKEESRFLSSVNQLSVSSISVPECKPMAGEDEIHRQTFEMWRDLLLDCMALAGIEDEATKFTVFKVKAGPRLLAIFKNTKSDSEAPDVSISPFENAMYRLKLYFGSNSDVMFQRRKLALMEQKAEESDLAFIIRVGDTAQLCDFDKTKEFEEIAKTVAEHARCKQVRVAALKMVSRNGSFSDLVDKVREIQAIRMNEEFFAVKHGPSGSIAETAMVAPVRVEYPRRPLSQRYAHRTDNRFAPYSRQDSRYNSRSYGGGSRFGQQTNTRTNRNNTKRRNAEDRSEVQRTDRCWRCLSCFHSASECNYANLVCRRCGKIGHIQRACSPSANPNINRTSAQETFEPEAKQSRIDAVDDKDAITKPTEQVNVTIRNDKRDADRYVIATVGTNLEEGIISARVAGLACDFLIDSGAQVNTVVENVYAILKRDQRYVETIYCF